MREYVRGLWLHHENSRPMSRGDRVVEQPHMRQHRTLQPGSASHPGRRRAVSVKDAATSFSALELRFRPTTPAVLANGLRRVPPLYPEATLAAHLLGRSTYPDVGEEEVELAAESAVEWLERIRKVIGVASIVERKARELIPVSNAPAWRRLLEA